MIINWQGIYETGAAGNIRNWIAAYAAITPSPVSSISGSAGTRAILASEREGKAIKSPATTRAING